MTKVDQLNIRVPSAFNRDPETARFFEHLLRIVEQLRNRTGGDTDTIDLTGLDSIVAGGDITAEAGQIIICTAAITVTLPIAPVNRSIVNVKTTNGEVIINGNGKNIEGDTTLILPLNDTDIPLYFSATLDEWLIL